MSSKRILYGAHASPPVRAVHMTLEALGLDYEFRDLDVLGGELKSPEYTKKNPQQTMPTFEEEDGTILTDSHAINAYLVRRYGKTDALYPKDFYQRALVDQRLHYEDGVLFVGLGRTTLGAIIRGTAKKEDIPEMISKVTEAFELLEVFLKDNQYIAGNSLTIADFSVATTLTGLTIVAPLDATKFPKLAAWFARIKELPYYGKVNDEGALRLQYLVNEKKKAANLI